MGKLSTLTLEKLAVDGENINLKSELESMDCNNELLESFV